MFVKSGIRKFAFSSALRLASVLLALAVSISALASEPIRIDIQKFAFSEKEITVAAGATLVWVNRDETPHTVTANDKSFTSKALDTDDSYEYTFTKEGDYSYYCVVHPFMTGIVHVRKQ